MFELKPTKLDKIPIGYFYSFFSGTALDNEEKNSTVYHMISAWLVKFCNSKKW